MNSRWTYAAAFIAFLGMGELGVTLMRKPPPSPPVVVVPPTPEKEASDRFMRQALAQHAKMYQNREAECARQKRKTGECAPVPVPLDWDN